MRNFGILEDNIQAAVLLTDMLCSSLGPKGMDKMLIDNIGDVHVTNDGFTIIDKMDIKHPVAKLIAETAKTQDKEVGDGTTTTVILTGELLKQALKLIKQGIHPTVIIEGFRKALEQTLKALKENAVYNINDESLKELINTSLSGKTTLREELTSVILEAVRDTNVNDVLIIKKSGLGMNDTKVVNGVIIDKEPVHERMPTELMNAKVLITQSPLEIEKPEVTTELEIRNPAQLSKFLEAESNKIKTLTDSVIKSGAKALLCQKGINEKAQETLARAGILAIRRIREKDIDALVRATKARLVDDLTKINPNDLGTAELIKTEKIGDENLTIIKGSGGIKTVLIRGSTKQVIDEMERSVNDALGVVKTIRAKQAYVPGAGLIELKIYKQLMNNNLKGKTRMSYEGYAKSMLSITETLIKNAGRKVTDLMPRLLNEEKGVDAEGEMTDAIKKGIIEPLKVKEQAINSATETAVMILRIDDILKGK